MSEEKQKGHGVVEFELWLRTKFVDQIWVGGHRFKKTPTTDIDVDGALLSEIEAKQLYSMLTSRNPLRKLNGSILVWERNGIFVAIFVIIALLMLLILYVIVRR